MKLVKPLLSILISLIFTLTSYAQDEFSGTVTKVIDGKTLVVEPHRGPEITLELQYIEVPEPGQKLYQIVKEHLKKLALNKQVKFIMKSLTNGKTYGRVFTDDGWLGEQMIRDGAAWYALPQKAGHDKTESEIYLKNESLARSEKRGIWSIEGILPAWEFRAKKERLKHSAYQQIQKQDVKVLPASGRNAKALRNRRLTPEERDQANANTQIWADVSWYGLLMSNFDLLMRHEETGGGVESWNSFDPGVQSPFATRLSVVELFDGKKKDKVFGMLVFIGNVGSFIGETPSPDNTISFFLFLSKSTNVAEIFQRENSDAWYR